jgi:sugar lactone lactonase YvrE
MTTPALRTVSAGSTWVLTLLVCAGLLAAPGLAGAQDEPQDSTKPKIKKKGDDANENPAPVKNPFPDRFPSPDLDGGIEWLNTSGEISLKDLRGKVVVLDFWTFCCINCMHVLPDLAYLEKKFDKELVVIGVHSAKFDNERESGNIRKAILRYEIAHPVINDAKMIVWRKFQVSSWPTLVLIDPEGFYCGAARGEGNRELLENVIEKVVAYHKAKGTLDEKPVQFALERHRQPDGPLKFPGKVLADPDNQRLFISDSNHNRIVVSSLDGKLLDVIGSGQIGREDGGYDQAQFDHPQGMCLVGNTLYVADTENHLLRTVDLDAKTVSTLAGNGKQGHFGAPGGMLQMTSLNSPWDVYALDGVLYIAMAGPHQIWSHKLGSMSIQPYAGDGHEDIGNGTLKDSKLAQPSGIASDGKSLFVVDSEGSSVRKISTKPGNDLDNPTGKVETLAGTSNLPSGQSLFAFGDVDGVGNKARLQHPLGIVFHDGKLLVADTYNHKLKTLDPETRRCETWLGTGKPGTELDPVQFAEPAGLTIAGNTVYVADTNNHRIVAVDLKSKAASEFTIAGLTPPVIPDDAEDVVDPDEKVDGIKSLAVKSGEPLKVEIGFDLPEGYKINELIPVKYTLTAEADQTVIAPNDLVKRKTAEFADGKAGWEIPFTPQAGKTELTITLSYGYCREGAGGVCKVGTSAWKIPVEASADAKPAPLTLTATPKK